MKVVFPDGKGGFMDWEDLKKSIDEEDSKKNFRNWLGNKFPNGWCNYHPYYTLTHPWKAVEYAIEELRFAWQRVFRGWDDRAVWSIDYHIAKLVRELVLALKERSVGYPFDMMEGLPVDENYALSPEDEHIAVDRWNAILDQIAEGFGEYATQKDSASSLDYNSDTSEKFNTAFDLFRKYFSNLWD